MIPRSRTTLKLVYDRVELEMRRGGTDRVLRLDTKEPVAEKDPKAADENSTFQRRSSALRALVGRSFEIVQLPSGMIERFDGLDRLKETLLKEGPDEPYYKRGVEGSLHTAYLVDTFRPGIVMPDAGMSLGDTLHFQDYNLLPEPITGLPGLLYLKGTYKLAGVEEGIARVEMEGDASLDPYGSMHPWPEQMRAGRKRLHLVKGSVKAWVKVRAETGVLEEAERVTDLDLYFVKPDGSGEIPIPLKVTQKVQRIP